MSSIGREVVEDAAKLPIVDAVDSRHIVTETARLKVCSYFPLTLTLLIHLDLIENCCKSEN